MQADNLIIHISQQLDVSFQILISTQLFPLQRSERMSLYFEIPLPILLNNILLCQSNTCILQRCEHCGSNVIPIHKLVMNVKQSACEQSTIQDCSWGQFEFTFAHIAQGLDAVATHTLHFAVLVDYYLVGWRHGRFDFIGVEAD